ncbi:hypothetical protein [Roseomonas gilardii]|uniref:hypothetical protein n=1 Tax=Roseomonas gilardii TaxID=257708 RepID=UPI0011A8AA7F|nr:hypothetical protein [Roseomonas gilardii]
MTRPTGLGEDYEPETPERFAECLARRGSWEHGQAQCFRVANDATIQDGIRRLVTVLKGAAARVSLYRLPTEPGRDGIAYLLVAGCAGAGRIEVAARAGSIRISVNLVEAGIWLAPDEIGLSADAFALLGLLGGTPVTIRRTPASDSCALMRCKIEGGMLDAADYQRLLCDMVEERYPGGQGRRLTPRCHQVAGRCQGDGEGALRLYTSHRLGRARTTSSPMWW